MKRKTLQFAHQIAHQCPRRHCTAAYTKVDERFDEEIDYQFIFQLKNNALCYTLINTYYIILCYIILCYIILYLYIINFYNLA